MSGLSQFIESGDWFTLFFLMGLLHCVGVAMSAGHPQAVWYAKRFSGATILVSSWSHLHAGNMTDASAVTRVAVRAVLSAGLVWGTSLILLTPVCIVLNRVSAWWQRMMQRRRERQRQRHERRLAEQQRREMLRQQREWDARAPERERQRQYQEQVRQQTEQEQRRRETLRFNCQLLFERHAAVLGDVLSRERFEALVALALPETLPLDVANQRSAQLAQMIDELLANTGQGKKKFRDLLEVANDFEARRQQVEQATLDELTKVALRASLNLQQEAAFQEFLRS